MNKVLALQAMAPSTALGFTPLSSLLSISCCKDA
jgi:hypothetical protein